MSYNRKIFYMNFYEGDEKRGNAGYIKVLESGGIQKAEVRISGISTIFDGERELEIMAGQTLLAKERVYLQAGGGTVSSGWEKREELTGISFRMMLSNGCSLDSQERKQVWQEETVKGETVKEETVTEKVERTIVEEEREESIPVMQELQMESVEEKEEVKQENPEKKRDVKEKVENRKWKQICKVYPHIKPFGDFREYIKLDLKDMVLISEKKYSLVENSFLLHGYYNYDHIILWRKEKTPMKYYIGVPGNFYEKEKQVAVLYGFESFEGAVEPAKEGDFGYYMTEVTI